MNKKKRYFLFALAISAVLGCYLLLGSFGIALDRRETTVSDSEGLMAIDPDKILQLISQNPGQAFTPISDLDYPAYRDSVSEIEPVLWGQSDYLSIVKTFFQVNWKDTIADWKIKDFLFHLSCDNAQVSLHPQSAQLKLYQVNNHDTGTDSRIERYIFISPHESLLEWGETEYSPDYSSHRYYDLSQVKISAEEALRIAEDNGGRDYRLSQNNECSISVFLKYSNWPLTDYNWRVYYSRDYSIEVDKRSGAYKIISGD